jgi:peptidoglycan/LPS O-acetylase OafA/YrhL
VVKFYIRRFLRLYPALLLSVLVSVLVYPMFNGHVPWPDILAALFYYANYYGTYLGFLRGSAPDHGTFHTFGILWSLAVEEQYYLVFPLLMLGLISDLRRAAWCFAAIMVACLVWRIWLYDNGMGFRNYGSTDTRIDSILVGALLAVWLTRPYAVTLVRTLSHPLSVLAGLGGIVFSLLYRDPWFRETVRYSLQGLCLMPIVAAACFSGRYAWVSAVLASRPMVWIGALSYSLYLFHGPAIVIGENLFKVVYVDPVSTLPAGYFAVSIVLTLAMSMLSYYGVEKPFFALRARFGSNVGR